MATRKETPPRVPKFASLEEEAAFWDSHSPLDYPTDWVEEPAVKTERPLGHILGVRLDATTIDTLAALARRKGIGPSTLARMWILERLATEPVQAQRQRPTHPSRPRSHSDV